MNEDDKRSRDLKNKKTILNYMQEKGIILESGNTFYAEKAFLVNSILSWCVQRCDDGIFTPQDVRFYFDSVDQYIHGEITIYWSEEGNLVIGA